jgi:hypothetical protein
MERDALTETQPKRPKWQIGLQSMFLLVTAVAVWTVYFSNRSAIRHLEERIESMRPLARELVVKDGEQFAIVKLEQHWYDENLWSVYIPTGEFRLCLATRDVDDTGFPPAFSSAPLAPGRHVLELDELSQDSASGNQNWRVAVQCDGHEILSAKEPKEWYPAVGSSGGGQFDTMDQQPADKPLVLFRRRFTQPGPGGRSTTPSGPADGIMLWIEQTGS